MCRTATVCWWHSTANMVLRTPGDRHICFGAPVSARKREYILTYVVQNITTNITKRYNSHTSHIRGNLHNTCLKTNTATVWVYSWKTAVHRGGANHKPTIRTTHFTPMLAPGYYYWLLCLKTHTATVWVYSWKNGVWVKIITTNTPQTTSAFVRESALPCMKKGVLWCPAVYTQGGFIPILKNVFLSAG